ncbi:hypothetical protein BDC45DRAFT_318938 [Circinella umbellata]|nr:hypothetical protein BDC45DRAFT_318938 [Circinella umbellata]
MLNRTRKLIFCSYRVWIRVNPTDTGRTLAQRIHVVATYKSRKILSVTTTSGKDIPLDDTAVFDGWSEIEQHEDGAPWEVEWGPLDHGFPGGRQFMKQLKAGLRGVVKEQ